MPPRQPLSPGESPSDVFAIDADAAGSRAQSSHGLTPGQQGAILGIFAAASYTTSNIALRQLSRPGDIDWTLLVTACKAMPVVWVSLVLIAYRSRQGLQALPPRKYVLPLLATGVLMQLGGNLMFQTALSLGGLAFTVPMVFCSLIATTAALGWYFLGEAVRGRTLVAVVLVAVSICVLSFGAEQATLSVRGTAGNGAIAAAIVVALISGFSFGTCGIVVRHTVQRVSLSGSLILISSVGGIGLGSISVFRLGAERLLAIAPGELGWLILAGVSNCAAFFAISSAMKRINVMQANLLNASQTAMAGTAGVLFFAEPLTAALAVGIVLTIAGLTVLGTGSSPVRNISPAPSIRKAAPEPAGTTL